MDDWLREAKALAKVEAETIFDLLCSMAEDHDLEPNWFIEEVLKAVNKLKGDLG